MLSSKIDLPLLRGPLAPKFLLLWYVMFTLAMAISPVDRKVWLGANMLPFFFVAILIFRHQTSPLSNLSYLAITVWLTLHTIAVHYTYPKVPLGFWVASWFDLHRNHFDRIVHFGFGFLLTYPFIEMFRRQSKGHLQGRLLVYLVVMTVLGLSAVWEILEAWVGQLAHPDLEMALVGHQGDVWDPQHDMASALYGSLLCVASLALVRVLRKAPSMLEPAPMSSEAIAEVQASV